VKDLSEMPAACKVERRLLESELQGQCVDWMRRRDYWARKFSSMTQRSVPDYLFAKEMKSDRYVAIEDVPLKFACEFKRPGTKPKLIKKYGVTVMSTEAQYEEQLAMRAAGWYVFECDDFSVFKGVVEALERDFVASSPI
jgi:hypothetical protein